MACFHRLTFFTNNLRWDCLNHTIQHSGNSSHDTLLVFCHSVLTARAACVTGTLADVAEPARTWYLYNASGMWAGWTLRSAYLAVTAAQDGRSLTGLPHSWLVCCLVRSDGQTLQVPCVPVTTCQGWIGCLEHFRIIALHKKHDAQGLGPAQGPELII